MQTFLPYTDYKKSAKSLDMRRLGKQRIEGLQILQHLLGFSTFRPYSRWPDHEVVKMWKGHEKELFNYTKAICDEWKRRGYKDSISERLNGLKKYLPKKSKKPSWLNEKLTKSHQSNLIRKLPEHYKPQFGRVPKNIPYHWPK